MGRTRTSCLETLQGIRLQVKGEYSWYWVGKNWKRAILTLIRYVKAKSFVFGARSKELLVGHSLNRGINVSCDLDKSRFGGS
jgi:hypothetical protein